MTADEGDAPNGVESAESADSVESLPVAEVVGPGASSSTAGPGGTASGGGFFHRYGTRLWWVTAVCVVSAVILVWSAFGGGGQPIKIRFAAGHGIKVGDPLRYRGIDVGVVTSIELSGELDAVTVGAMLQREAAGVAREGTRFWIERPQVSLSRVRGLETVVGAKAIGVLPASAAGKPQTEFVGIETPLSSLEAGVREVTIRFRSGHGLAAGDPVKYRGIVVGEVVSVALTTDLGRVKVRVQLTDGAATLARVGSQFWVERPQVSVTGVRGLDTLVGGRFVAVLPGPPSAAAHEIFDGLEHPPAAVDRPEGGLEIVLMAAHRSGLRRGAPVTYRGVQVGYIAAVGLSTDGSQVEARAYIQPAYKPLIRMETRFWVTSGVDFRIGWTGVKMDMESIETMAAGGVALATPADFTKVATTGQRFELASQPDPVWLAWEPRVPIGSSLLPAGRSLPNPHRVALRWQVKSFGFTRDRQLDAWALVLESGQLLGPAEALGPASDAVDGRTQLALAGGEFQVLKERVRRWNDIATFDLSVIGAGGESGAKLNAPWPLNRLRSPDGPEDCLVVAGSAEESMPLSAGRLTVSGEASWAVDPALPMGSEWHGAPVVSRRDGALIGVVVVADQQARVAPLPVDLR